MKNNTTKLLIILAILLGVFLIVKLTGDTSRSKSFRSALVEIDTARVSRIQIASPEDSTVIVREEDKWVVNGKPADKQAVKSLLSNLQMIKPSRIASRSPEQWKDFQVDDQGTRVVIYEGSDKALDIILGRFNVEGQRSFYSYVRLDEDQDTYVAKDFMKMSVGANAASYRNDDVLSIMRDSLAAIDFNYPDTSFSLYKKDDVWQLEEAVADSASVAKYLQGLSRVASKNFTEKPASAAQYDIVYRLTSGETIEVAAYGDNQIGTSYNPDEYWQDEALHAKLFKGKAYFTEE